MSTKLSDAAAAYSAAQDELEAARKKLRAEVLRELSHGMPQAAIVRITGLSREHLRRWQREDEQK